MGNICSPTRIRIPLDCLARGIRSLQLFTATAILLFLLTPTNADAQETPEPAPAGPSVSQSSAGLGINAIISHTPQEADLSDVGGQEDIDKYEIYFDWAWMRIGFNMTHAALDFTAYSQNWQTRLKKDTTYLAYRLSSEDGQSKWDLFALAGLAYTTASFTIEGVESQSSSDLGYVTGGGALYNMGRLALGMEVLIISTEGSFNDLKISTGSTQVLSGFKLRF